MINGIHMDIPGLVNHVDIHLLALTPWLPHGFRSSLEFRGRSSGPRAWRALLRRRRWR